MKFTTKTEYGLVGLIYMARNHSNHCVTVKEIVKNERFSLTYMEKILQKLKAAKIVQSHQGKSGGFSLVRSPSEITLKEIIEALEGHTFAVYCEPKMRQSIVCTHFNMCGVRPVWMKTKELLDHFFGTVTLETIANTEDTVHGMVA